MVRRLSRQGEARKAQLLARAAELFAERGYTGTRVVDIVRAAGVAKGLFYWYFDNKDAIFRELIQETRHRLRVTQAEAMAGVRGPLAQLHAATLATVRFMLEHRQLYALMQIEGQGGGRFTEDVRGTTAVHAADTARLIDAGQRAGVVRTDDDPLALAYGVLGTVLHFVYFHRTGRLDMPVDDFAATVARFVTRALAASDADADDAQRAASASRVLAARA